MTSAITLLAAFVAFFFFAAGLTKLRSPSTFAQELEDYQLIPNRYLVTI